MKVTRREMLARAGGAAAVLALSPVAKAVEIMSSNPIQVKTKSGLKALHFECQRHNGLPKVYQLYAWWDIKKLYPKAFIADDNGLDFTEESAKNVLVNELIDRASIYFLSRLEADHKDFKEDVIVMKHRLPYYLFMCLYSKTEKLLDEAKGVPYPGTRIPDSGLQVGSIAWNTYVKHFDTNRVFIRNHPGIFTNFTEAAADKIVQKLTQISYDRVYAYVRGNLEKSYF